MQHSVRFEFFHYNIVENVGKSVILNFISADLISTKRLEFHRWNLVGTFLKCTFRVISLKRPGLSTDYQSAGCM